MGTAAGEVKCQGQAHAGRVVGGEEMRRQPSAPPALRVRISCPSEGAGRNPRLGSATVVLERTLESPLDCQEMQPVHYRDQSWVFIGRTDAETETPIFWPPNVKS